MQLAMIIFKFLIVVCVLIPLGVVTDILSFVVTYLKKLVEYLAQGVFNEIGN